MKRFMVIFSLLFILATVYAFPFSIDYSYVNTDSELEYLNLQYGNFYDNVSLKIRLSAQDIPNGYTYVPVIVSPKVYGITSSGLNYLYSVPSSTYYLSGANEYYYPNLFYLTPEYNGYVIKVYARSGTSYSTYSSAYVYPLGYSPSYFYPVDDDASQDDTQEETAGCSSFFLSGQRDIYLDEDDQRNYNLYIENDSSQELTVLSVTTSDPSELDISDIDYPEFVSGNYVGTVILRLESDTVSDDEDSSFEIYVRARYGSGQECLKTYTVNYHINDEDNENSGSCSDISIEDTKFSLDEGSFAIKTIRIVNESEDYDYEIDDITIDDDSDISSSIRDEPSIVHEDSSQDIIVEFETETVSYTTVRYLDLEIEGYLVRPGRDDKRCTKRADLVVTILNQSSEGYGSTSQSQTCKDIVIYTTNILQAEDTIENYSQGNGFFIANNSNQQFTITGLALNDNTSKANVINLSYEPNLYPKGTTPLSFDLETNQVFATDSVKGTITLTGRFADGKSCLASDIGTKQFDITVLDTTDTLCNNVGVYNTIVQSGSSNQVSLFNNTEKKFYVTNVLFQNRYGVSAQVATSQLAVNPVSQATLSVGITGMGSVEMLISGRFEDGKSCAYSSTRSGFLTTDTEPANLSGDTCSFDLSVPSTLQLNNATETFTISFLNSTPKAGKILISGNGLAIEPSIIYLDGFDNFNKVITISNFNNPLFIYYDVALNGCPSRRIITNLSSGVTDIQRLSLVSYPTLISPISGTTAILVTVANNYSSSKTVRLRLSGFPSDFSSPDKTVDIPQQSRKNISLSLTIPSNAEKRAYNGYIELYSGATLISSSPLTIDLTPKQEPVIVSVSVESKEKVYYIKLTLKNNTPFTQYTTIDFGLDDSFVIEGDREINILPSEELVKEYRVVSQGIVKEDKITDITLKDKDSLQVLAREKLTLKASPSAITGFFSLGNIGLIILGLIIVIVLVFIFKKK